MDIPDDFEPTQPRPVATVRRHGEAVGQQEMRGMGYDDFQTGYGLGGRGRGSALQRSYQISAQRERERRIQSNEAATQQLDQEKLQIRQQEYQHTLMKEQAAVAQKKADLANENQFLQKVHDAQDKFGSMPNGLRSAPYFMAIQQAGIEHGIGSDTKGPGAIINHAIQEGSKVGAGQDVAAAHFEINQVLHPDQYGIDVNTADRKAWLDAIPTHYPEAFNSPFVRQRFEQAMKEISPAPAKTPPPHQVSPTDQGFISRYSGAVQGVKDVQSILDKGGLNLNSQWNGSDTDIDKAVVAGKITHDEAATAAKALATFRNTVQAGTSTKNITNLQPHFDEISGKLSALTPAAQPAGLPSTKPSSNAPADNHHTDGTKLDTLVPVDSDDIHAHADAAIKAGADPDSVMERLKKLGGDPARLTYDE